MTRSLVDSERSALRSRHDPFLDRTGAAEALRNIQLGHIHVEVVISVRDRAVKKLQQILRSTFRRVLQNRSCFSDVLAPNQVKHDPYLAR